MKVLFFLLLSQFNLNAKTPDIMLDGLTIVNNEEEGVFTQQAEGPRDPVGTIIFSNSDKSKIFKIKTKKDLEISPAQKLMNQKIIQLVSTYRPTEVPYAGAITNSIDCSKKYNFNKKYEDKDDFIGVDFDLNANEQFAFGVCEEDKLIYKVKYSLFYCKKSKKFYEIKYFDKKTSTKQTKIDFKCS